MKNKHLKTFESFNKINETQFQSIDDRKEQNYQEAFSYYEKALILLREFETNITNARILFEDTPWGLPDSFSLVEKYIIRNYQGGEPISNEMAKDIYNFKKK